MKIDDLTPQIEKCKEQRECIDLIRPIIIQYIQASLPLSEITEFIQPHFNLKLSPSDLFSIILRKSENDVKALILERYSLIYPIPLMQTSNTSKEITMFH